MASEPVATNTEYTSASYRQQSRNAKSLRIDPPVINFPDSLYDNDAPDTTSRRTFAPFLVDKPLMARRQPQGIQVLQLLKTFCDLHWISQNLSVTRFKPVIRCSVAAWLSLILLVIPRVERAMGQAGFLILMAAFISPPSDCFVAVLERELIVLCLNSLAFGWSCLGIKLASLTRRQFFPQANINDIATGQYIEVAPTIICGIFLFLGSAFFLYVKSRKGPGPFVWATILVCITMDLSLTTAPLFPYAYYTMAKSAIIPITMHSAVCLLCSIFVFPETVNAQFAKRLRVVLSFLAAALEEQPEFIDQLSASAHHDVSAFTDLVSQAERSLNPLTVSTKLMKRDFSWGRFGADDLCKLTEVARRLTLRANGMSFYFKVIDPSRDRFPGTPTASMPQTPFESTPSSPASPTGSVRERKPRSSLTPTTSRPAYHRSPSSYRLRHGHVHFTLSNHHFRHHLFREVLQRSEENAVGVFESQQYLNLETKFYHPNSHEYLAQSMNLLRESTADLLAITAESLRHVTKWLERINTFRFAKVFGRGHYGRADALREHRFILEKLDRAINNFRTKKRHRVVDLYRQAMGDTGLNDQEPPPHRYLYQCFIYQYHLLQFSLQLQEMIQDLHHLEEIRHYSRLWVPSIPFKKVFSLETWDITDPGAGGDDEDPNVIPGMDNEHDECLGDAQYRDPDALPPHSTFGAATRLLHHLLLGLSNGHVVFALKAGFLSVLLTLPSYMPSTARFAYVHKLVWAIVMGQLTLSRFRGDTSFEFVMRLLSTLFGAVMGLAVWYIGSGSGPGNSFGLAAVTAVCFPVFFFFRIYWPGRAMTMIIFFMTAALVIGFSWQDTHIFTLTSPGSGWPVAWKRLVLVAAGVTSAFIFSFLPPSMTLRGYVRVAYATTIAQLGQIYCDIVSFASTHNHPENQSIIKNLVAIRMKLRRVAHLADNVAYEVSLQGTWPKERYKRSYEIQMEIAYLLSHLRSAVEHLEPSWSRAFLRRTRFLQPDFQGDVLAVISMIHTALQTRTPLPQITPCPLIDRFLVQDSDQRDLLRYESMNDTGIPQALTIDTLEDEQYLCFSVGISTAFGIITRLDRLMVATKELVGEHYHIHGLGFVNSKSPV